MKPRTHRSIRADIWKVLKFPLTHPKTESNQWGQSGAYTFVNDLIDIVLGSECERDACVRIYKYLVHAQDIAEIDEV